MKRTRRSRKTNTKGPRTSPTLLERINLDAAGIDCGSKEHYVAVPPDRDPNPVQSFPTFTDDLNRLADWLVKCGVKTVAMESTGVYWIPIFEILEARGLEVLLVNARHVKNVPGRKSDVCDAEWLQTLHSVGLLRGGFRPAADIATLRAYVRHRQTLVQSAATHVQRMQKALVQMNLQLPVVISDIVGVTGLMILRDIVAGQTDPKRLAQHRDQRCKATTEEIIAALTGNYRPEYVFVLKQNLEMFDAHQTQMTACDAAIEAHLKTLAAKATPPTNPLPPPRTKGKPRGNEPRFDIRTPLHGLTGIDLAQIDGIGSHNALRIVSEIGIDMTRWPSADHFASWITLAPHNKITGGRVISSQTQSSANRVADILRNAAMSVGRTETALGAFYRRIAFRIGKAKAITATARKLAILIYHVLRGDFAYKDPGAETYNAQNRVRALRRLRQRAHGLGFALVNQQTGEVLEPTAAL